MKLLILILLQIGIWNISFADEIADIDSRISAIDARIAEIVVELTPINTAISELDSQIAPIDVVIDSINGGITLKQGEIDAKQGEIDAKQALIDSKIQERDALEEGDPQIAVLQGELDVLVAEKDALMAEKAALVAEYDQYVIDLMDQEALKAPLVEQKNIKLSEKLALESEDGSLDNEKINLVERKRVIVWNNRFDALPDLRLAMGKAGFDVPNAKLFRKNIIKDKDEAKLIALESVVPAVTADLQKQAIMKGIDARFACSDKVKKKMFYMNYIKGLTKQQVKQFVSTFKDIIDLVNTGSLETARDDIVALNLSGSTVTEEERTELLAVIDSCK